jgi:hypothetical protein
VLYQYTSSTNIVTRVKLPKSFLAVNLSESHTFHKKSDSVADASFGELKADDKVVSEEIGEVSINPEACGEGQAEQATAGGEVPTSQTIQGDLITPQPEQEAHGIWVGETAKDTVSEGTTRQEVAKTDGGESKPYEEKS